MIAIPRNEWQNSGGNLIYGHPGGSNTHILTKITPNIGIIQIIALFGTFDNAKYPKYTFMIKHDGISSILITKQGGVTLYIDTPGGRIPIV